MNKELKDRLYKQVPETAEMLNTMRDPIRLMEPNTRIFVIALIADMLEEELEQAKKEQKEKYVNMALDFFRQVDEFVEQVYKNLQD